MKKETKSFIIRLSPELHKKMKLISVKNNCSLNEYAIKAFEKIVKSEEQKENNNGIK